MKVKLTPAGVTVVAARVGDPRVGHLIGSVLSNDTAAAIVGFPVDDGVARNGGRIGAAKAPHAIREALYKLTPDAEASTISAQFWTRVADLGDIPWGGDLAAAQEELGEVVAELLGRGVVPIILGGGHETAYGHFLGYVNQKQSVSIINIDAHLDVRELIDGAGHSGSPFRQALEHPQKLCAGYQVLGVQPQSCAVAHLEYLKSKGGRATFRAGLSSAELSKVIGGASASTMLSMDIDAVDEAAAPGVSAPCINGLSSDLWLHAALLGGANPKVKSFDIVECNPAFDTDNRTARLAALTVWTIVKGIAERQSAQGRPRLGFG